MYLGTLSHSQLIAPCKGGPTKVKVYELVSQPVWPALLKRGTCKYIEITR